MLIITTDQKAITFQDRENIYTRPLGDIDYNIIEGNTVIFFYKYGRRSQASVKFGEFTLNGETLTPSTADQKLKDALFI